MLLEGMSRKPAVDWCEGFKEGAVAITEVNRNALVVMQHIMKLIKS